MPGAVCGIETSGAQTLLFSFVFPAVRVITLYRKLTRELGHSTHSDAFLPVKKTEIVACDWRKQEVEKSIERCSYSGY